MAVYQLDDELWFPDPHLGEADGLVAVGGDLSINGYSKYEVESSAFLNEKKKLIS